MDEQELVWLSMPPKLPMRNLTKEARKLGRVDILCPSYGVLDISKGHQEVMY